MRDFYDEFGARMNALHKMAEDAKREIEEWESSDAQIARADEEGTYEETLPKLATDKEWEQRKKIIPFTQQSERAIIGEHDCPPDCLCDCSYCHDVRQARGEEMSQEGLEQVQLDFYNAARAPHILPVTESERIHQDNQRANALERLQELYRDLLATQRAQERQLDQEMRDAIREQVTTNYAQRQREVPSSIRNLIGLNPDTDDPMLSWIWLIQSNPELANLISYNEYRRVFRFMRGESDGNPNETNRVFSREVCEQAEDQIDEALIAELRRAYLQFPAAQTYTQQYTSTPNDWGTFVGGYTPSPMEYGLPFPNLSQQGLQYFGYETNVQAIPIEEVTNEYHGYRRVRRARVADDGTPINTIMWQKRWTWNDDYSIVTVNDAVSES